MMKFAVPAAGVLMSCTMLIGPAGAHDLLGGAGSGALVTIGGGQADDSGLINVGLGGGGGNIVDANVLPTSSGASVANANLSVGSGSLVSTDLSVLGTVVNSSADILGSDGTTSANASLLGGTVSVNGIIKLGSGSGGNSGGGGSNGGGNGGSKPGPVAGAPGSGPGAPGARPGQGGGGAAIQVQLACSEVDQRRALGLFNGTAVTERAISQWYNAKSVRVVHLPLCASERSRLGATLAGSAKLGMIQSHVATAGVLSGSGYGQRNVLAVDESGGQLTVFVY